MKRACSRRTRRKTWRCFHCDEVFRSHKSAYYHFGPDDGCEKDPPACIDPLRADEKERLMELKKAQDYAMQCQESANKAEDLSEMLERELAEWKTITKCENTYQLRMKMDSAHGELITARMLINAIRTKAPDVYEEIVS